MYRYMAVQNITALLVDCGLLIYPMDGLQNVINIVEFLSLLHKQQLDLKNEYQHGLLSVDDFAGYMDVMTI